MTPCEEKGYKVGQVFEVIADDASHFSIGSVVALASIKGRSPVFDLVRGECTVRNGKRTEKGCSLWLKEVKRIYPRKR